MIHPISANIHSFDSNHNIHLPGENILNNVQILPQKILSPLMSPFFLTLYKATCGNGHLPDTPSRLPDQ